MYLFGVALFGERALAHAEDDLRATVVEHQEVVGQWVNGEALDLAAATEVLHLAEQCEGACESAACDEASALHHLAVLVGLHVPWVSLHGLCALLQAIVTVSYTHLTLPTNREV